MNPNLPTAFDALAPLCEVSAPLGETTGAGVLDMPLELRIVCTRIGLPQARVGNVERALIAGQSVGVFTKATELTWQVRNKALASQLAPLLRGAYLYCSRVHRDEDLVEVVLTKPVDCIHHFLTTIQKQMLAPTAPRETLRQTVKRYKTWAVI